MYRTALVLLLAGFLPACTTMNSEPEPSVEPESDTSAIETLMRAQRVNAEGATAAVSTEAITSAVAAEAQRAQQPAEPIIYRGTSEQIRMPDAAPPVTFLGEDVSLNFEQAPLSEVVHAVMGDILGLDYIVDQPVQGNVTLRTRSPIPRAQLLEVLESLLTANGAMMVRRADGRYFVTGSQQGVRLAPGVSNPESDFAGYSTIVVPLQYIGAGAMAEILQPVATDTAFVRVDTNRNLLMLAGTREQLEGWLDIIATFDVDRLKGMSVGLFPLENSDVEEVTAALSAILMSEGASEMVRVVPVERLNSVLLVTSRSHYLDTLHKWIKRLDSIEYTRFEKRLYVYPVQNTAAVRLANLLNSIYSDEFGASASQGPVEPAGNAFDDPLGGVAPGLSSETVGDDLDGASFGAGAELPEPGGSALPRQMSSNFGGSAGSLAGVRVVADEENNALMIYGTGKQYELIKSALAQLDVVATQVMIEASIVEVTLSDELQYGLEWSFKRGLGNDYEGEGIWSSSANRPAATLPGFSYSLTNAAGDISAVLNALSEDSLLNVISTPSVMVLDNHTAYIHVGDQVPIIERRAESEGDGDRVIQSVEYRDTGVKLTVTPSVNAGGLVTMDIAQSVTDVGDLDLATQQTTFLERNIVSRVAVRSNESVVLGGLIRDNASRSESGVPFLSKLPLVGPLFGVTNNQARRTELLVIITPRAVFSDSELREVSEEMRTRVRNLELIEVPSL